jgi:ABC-2 type transport system permease protein
MSAYSKGLSAVVRLDAADVLRSRWLLFSGAVYASLAAAFVLVGTRESTVMAYTGFGRTLTSLTHVLVLLLPLLALTATGQLVSRARDDGALELLLAYPIRRSAYLLGVTLVRYLALFVPLALVMLAVAFVAAALFRQEVPWALFGRSLALSGALLWAFVGVGLAVSTTARDQTKSLVALLVVWALVVALLDFGLVALMLRLRLNPRAVFVLAGLNPVQCVRVALLAGGDPDLQTMGPVGFYLAHRIGSGGLLALGIGWPAAVGTASFAYALRRFTTRDLV